MGRRGTGLRCMGACQQALADNPRYSMAMLLREALDAAAPPSMARLPMTPEEVAAATTPRRRRRLCYPADDVSPVGDRRTLPRTAAVLAGEAGRK